MDIVLAKTFLAVIGTKSFVAAADSLYVTQSAVSLRMQKLEAMLGGRLVERSKSGVEPTALGDRFEEYARSFIQLWDETTYQLSLPTGFDGTLSVACQDSLWPELSAPWVSMMETEMPSTALNFQILAAEVITRRLVRGMLDIAVVYTPEIRPGLMIEKVMDDQLVLVSANGADQAWEEESYVYNAWGAEFAIAHSRWFPSFKPPQLTMSIGTSMPRFLIENRKSAFLPYRIADDYVERGDLHFVPDTPRFPYPAYAIWSQSSKSTRTQRALELLRNAAHNAPWISL